jgi:hypothetical protein
MFEDPKGPHERSSFNHTPFRNLHRSYLVLLFRTNRVTLIDGKNAHSLLRARFTPLLDRNENIRTRVRLATKLQRVRQTVCFLKTNDYAYGEEKKIRMGYCIVFAVTSESDSDSDPVLGHVPKYSPCIVECGMDYVRVWCERWDRQ